MGIEINAAERSPDAVITINPKLLGHSIGSYGLFARRAELAALGFQSPGRDLLLVIKDQRTDTDDLTILNVDEDRTTAVTEVEINLLYGNASS